MQTPVQKQNQDKLNTSECLGPGKTMSEKTRNPKPTTPNQTKQHQQEDIHPSAIPIQRKQILDF